MVDDNPELESSFGREKRWVLRNAVTCEERSPQEWGGESLFVMYIRGVIVAVVAHASRGQKLIDRDELDVEGKLGVGRDALLLLLAVGESCWDNDAALASDGHTSDA
jgi:hypothetical protein